MLSHHVDTDIIIAVTQYLLHLVISLSQWLQELIVVFLKLVLALAMTAVLGSIGILSHIQAVNTHFLHDSFLSLADSQHTILEGDTFEHRTLLQLSVELSKGSIITQKMLLVGWSSLPQSHLLSVLVHSLQEVNGTLTSVALWDGWSLGILRQIVVLLPLVQVMLKLVIAQGESGITILRSSWAQSILQKRSNHMLRQLGRDSVADDGMAQILREWHLVIIAHS